MNGESRNNTTSRLTRLGLGFTLSLALALIVSISFTSEARADGWSFYLNSRGGFGVQLYGGAPYYPQPYYVLPAPPMPPVVVVPAPPAPVYVVPVPQPRPYYVVPPRPQHHGYKHHRGHR